MNVTIISRPRVPPVQVGSLDSRGRPMIAISVCGRSEQFSEGFEAVVDTGFSGFLTMPSDAARSLALAPHVVADQRPGSSKFGVGTVLSHGQLSHGVIVLEPNGQGASVGMEFLRKNRKVLLVSNQSCYLMNEDWANAVVAEACQHRLGHAAAVKFKDRRL